MKKIMNTYSRFYFIFYDKHGPWNIFNSGYQNPYFQTKEKLLSLNPRNSQNNLKSKNAFKELGRQKR